MSTLTQILLAAVMNSLGFTGEITEHCATLNTRTVTELIINHSCNDKKIDTCAVVNKNEKAITNFG